MRRLFAWLAGAAGGAAAYRALRRRPAPLPAEDDSRADELRAKLAEARAADDREEFEAGETLVDGADMARRVPADLEDALAANPGARERFWALPAEQKDRWVGWVERARLPRTRRRRVAEAVRRLGGRPAAATTVQHTNGAGPAVVPREDWLAWVLGLVLLAALAAFLVWLTAFRHHNHHHGAAVVVTAKATVPKVVGLRFQAAQFQLRQAKLGSTIVKHKSTKPRGIVIGQKPASKATVPQGTTVRLVVSNGPPGIAMPDVTGLAAADAVKALQARKLVPTLQQVASQQPPGTVVAQKPAAGAHAKPGTKVLLQVAKAAAPVAVPSVTGQSVQQATATLQQAGLKATTASVPSSQPRGTVVAQHPAAGQKIARGSAVRLNVAATAPPGATTTAAHTTTLTTTKASAPSKGNDYTGMRLADAVQKIAQGRQQVIVQYVTSSKPAGVVVANSTAGSKEQLQVSAGPNPKPAASVPTVTGENADAAKHDLTSAGFTVIEVQWPVSDQTQMGNVTYETPTGSVPGGSAIVMYVGAQ